MTSAGQAAAAALKMHSTPVKQQQQQQQQQRPNSQRYYTARSNSMTTGRSNSLRLYTYNPKPSYNVGNGSGRSYSLSSRHSYNGRPGVTSPLQHEYIHEEGGDLEEEEEVVTTKTTRVVDSSGRTTSITTKTIRTLPDGSNIIETTTKNISRPTSRLNSMSSSGNANRGPVAADVNLGMIEEFENFDYSRSELDAELDGAEKLKLNTGDLLTSPKQQLGAAFSPAQNYERTTSLNSVGKPRSILKNSAGSIRLSHVEPIVANGTHHESPPSSIRFNPTVQTRQYSPKESRVKVKKEKLTDEELYAAAYKAANKKVFGDGAEVVQPPPPVAQPSSPESAKKSKYKFIPLSPREPPQPTVVSPKVEQKPAVVPEAPKSPNYILTMRDQPQRASSRRERLKEEKRLAKARAKEEEEEEKRRLKEEAEEDKRRAKEEAEEDKRRAKEEADEDKRRAKDEKRKQKEDAKLAKEQEKGNKKRKFLDKFIARRRSSASSHSVITGEAPVANGVAEAPVVAAATSTAPATVVAATATAPVAAATAQVPAQVPATNSSLNYDAVPAATIPDTTTSIQVANGHTVKDAVVEPPLKPEMQPETIPETIPEPIMEPPTSEVDPIVSQEPVEEIPKPNINDGEHDHTEGSKTIIGHGKFYYPKDPEGVVPDHSKTPVAHQVAKESVQDTTGPVEAANQHTSNGNSDTAGILTDSHIYYSASDLNVNRPNGTSSPLDVVKVSVPKLQSTTSSQTNLDSIEPTHHVPVPHLQLLDDNTVDVELDNVEDDDDESAVAVDVIDDYRSTSDEPIVEAPIEAHTEPIRQELPPPNVLSTSVGNTPQITAVPVMKPTVDAQIPEPEVPPAESTEPVEELVVEKKAKETKRQRFLKFFVL